MNSEQASELDATRRARIVERLGQMVASGRMTADEAERVRLAADPGAFEEALRAVRVRHARERLGPAVEDDRLTHDEAEDLLERLQKGEHSSSLRAKLRGHERRTASTSGSSAASDDPGVRDSPGVIAPPPLIYLAGLLLGVGVGVVVRPPALLPAAAWPLGGLLVAAGLVLGFAFVRAFRRAGTSVDARGPATVIVTNGPFRISRNPGYLSMALVYTGIALAVGATWAFVTLIPTLVLIDRGVIAREERYLERTFGEDYTRFKTRVRRWL